MPGIDLGLTVTFVNNAQAGLRNLAGGIKQVGDNAQATHNRLKAIQVVIAGILLQKTVQLGRAFLDAASANQMLDIRLAHFAGGMANAEKLMKRLNAEFGATPFVVDDIAKAWAKLQSVIGNNERTTTIIEAIVNDVAAMGGSNQDIENVAAAFQKLGSRGQASLKDMNSLLEGTGISLADLAAAAGVSFTEFDRQLRKGQLTSAQFTDAFVKASKEKFGNYAEGLKATIGGAWKSVQNTVDQAISDIGSRTDLFTRIAVIFNNIQKAVEAWAASIDQADIDEFFKTLASFEQPIRNVASLMITVGLALIKIASITGQILSNLPPEVTEWGLIGYMLGGKKLALLGAMIGYIDSQISKLTGNPTVTSILKAMAASAPSTLGGGLSGIAAGNTKALQDMLDTLSGKKAGPGNVAGETSAQQQAREQQLNYLNDLKRALDETTGKLAKLNMEAGGDQLGVQIQDAVNKTDEWKAALQNILDKNKELTLRLPENSGIIKEIKDLVAKGGPIDQGLQQQIQHYTRLRDLADERFRKEQAILQLSLEEAAREIERNANQGAGFNLFAGTGAGQLEVDVMNRRNEMQRQSLEISTKIKDIEIQIEQNRANGKNVEWLEGTIDGYKRLQNATLDALSNLTAAGELGKQVWQEQGQAIESGAISALENLANHTKSFGDIINDVYAQITRSAAKYLVQLLEIDSHTGGAGGGFDIGGLLGKAGNFVGGLFGGAAANGGVFPGGVKAFANGGLITGPTMFGLAGEAGTEAIMPLTRIGGKLGVKSAGGGGDIHVHLSAIDTQSGIDFLKANVSELGQMLQHRSMLNRSGR